MKVLSPRVEISAVAVAIFTLAWAKKNQNQKTEDEQSGIFVSWRLTTLVKLSVDVSDV